MNPEAAARTTSWLYRIHSAGWHGVCGFAVRRPVRPLPHNPAPSPQYPWPPRPRVPGHWGDVKRNICLVIIVLFIPLYSTDLDYHNSLPCHHGTGVLMGGIYTRELVVLPEPQVVYLLRAK